MIIDCILILIFRVIKITKDDKWMSKKYNLPLKCREVEL